jgi:hypothetical protein
MIQESLERHSGPFEWGVSDCVHFVRDAVFDLTGVSLPIPPYASQEAAQALLAASSLSERFQAGLDEIAPSEAPAGAVVTARFRGVGEICGVVVGRVFWVKASVGRVPVDMSLASRAFRCRKP